MPTIIIPKQEHMKGVGMVLRNRAIWEEEEMTATEKLLFIYLKDVQGKPVSARVISKHTGLDYKTIFRLLASLEDKGILTRSAVGRTNVYDVVL